MNWYFKVLGDYAVFSGRARRKEFWYFVLFTFLISILLGVLDTFLFLIFGGGFPVLSCIYTFAVFIPSLAVLVRRLHDTGRSAWWLLWYFIPLGCIAVLIVTLFDSEPGTNKYGPNPK